MSVDYAKLARQHGGSIAPSKPIDYAAMALEFEGSSQPQNRGAGGVGRVLPSMNGPAVNAAQRFVGGMASELDPRRVLGGLAQAVAHPIDTAMGLVDAQALTAVQAYDAAKAGNYGEAANRAGMAAIPVLGPMGQGIVDEMQETGDIAGGLGRAAGMAATVPVYGAVGKAAGRVIKPITRGLRNATDFTKDAAKASAKIYLETDSGMAKSAIKGTVRTLKDRGKQAKAEFEARKASKATETPKDAPEATEGMYDARTGERVNLTPEQAKEAVANQPWNKAKPKAPEPPKSTGDVVEAKPAFKGQQSAKGATKARFDANLERNVAKWAEGGSKPEVIQARVKQIFKRDLSLDEIDTLIMRAKGK